MTGGLRWVRLDATFNQNAKIIELADRNRHRAIAVYCCSLSYAGFQGTEGWIPAGALIFIHARKIDAAHLVEVGLWVEQPGGWLIHDWLEYQPSNETNEMRTKRARAAAHARWYPDGAQQKGR